VRLRQSAAASAFPCSSHCSRQEKAEDLLTALEEARAWADRVECRGNPRRSSTFAHELVRQTLLAASPSPAASVCTCR